MRARKDQPEQRSRPRPSTVRPAAAQGSASSVMALQGAAGNRAVSSIVARSADRAVQRSADEEALAVALRRIDEILDPDALGAPAGGGASPVQTSRVGVVQRQEPEKPPEPKPGTPGDVAKAVLATPEGKQAVQILKTKAESDLKALKPGEKAAVVTATLAIAAPAVTAAMMRADSRTFLLDQVSGKKVDIPGMDGVSAKIDFKDGKPTGGMVYFNVGKVLPASWGFK